MFQAAIQCDQRFLTAAENLLCLQAVTALPSLTTVTAIPCLSVVTALPCTQLTDRRLARSMLWIRSVSCCTLPRWDAACCSARARATVSCRSACIRSHRLLQMLLTSASARGSWSAEVVCDGWLCIRHTLSYPQPWAVCDASCSCRTQALAAHSCPNQLCSTHSVQC